jgi:beta-phosphoglucomutase-like phosphatase (HAD superfamily)
MFKAILWDMDGTLVDTERVVWVVLQRSFREVASIDLPEEVFLSLLGQSEQDFYRAMAKQHALDDARVLAIRAHFDAAYVPMLATVPPLPGAVEKVREFARYAPQALVTGSSNEQAAAVLDALDLRDAFKHIVACDSYAHGKPDPEPFLLAADLLGVEPRECLVIEDSPSGVTAAKAAGMKVVGIHEGNKGKYNIAHADVELSSLRDLQLEAVTRLL